MSGSGDELERKQRREKATEQFFAAKDLARPQAPAGWYPDPDMPSAQRYWDGDHWTEARTSAPNAPASPSAQAQAASASPATQPFAQTPHRTDSNHAESSWWNKPVTSGSVTVPLWIPLVALAGLLMLSLVLLLASPLVNLGLMGGKTNDRWIEAVEDRMKNCGAASSLDLRFDKAEVVPNQEMVDNFGDHPPARYHYVHVPMDSMTTR